MVNNLGGNCDGAIAADRYNLQFPGVTCGGSVTEADPVLGPLRLNPPA